MCKPEPYFLVSPQHSKSYIMLPIAIKGASKLLKNKNAGQKAGNFLKKAANVINTYNAGQKVMTRRPAPKPPGASVPPPKAAPVPSDKINIFGMEVKKSHAYIGGTILVLGVAAYVGNQYRKSNKKLAI